ncbi:uncharacterized protein L969DRAFT_96290 [Mixia osmundae IAM 14324]|uniref:Histidinol-phosphatase n=1 Tax=Mixia osmundae (strain CBS 9802 / IAM 14324 / JCM 22182 / KY 12970) TaxID=764103 RepID=G7E501_MIXOS|nr:uncharacterized protein L969DRAFT_96290 [Mixia osmundae IAM 14324]KEI37772.1 hypothetical protein L969DRAFT_96290 [Mixia osmundae IAM 14324]GAA97911.1 hypothetical protein E5Q_04591 [Mixia osmundae IAM 14324]
MLVSLHSHSGEFCRHASGSLEEVVESAIAKGFKVYGLSEHVHRFDMRDLYPEEAGITLEDLSATFERFTMMSNHLKAKYADKIELLVGMETENIRQGDMQRTLDVLKHHSDRIDYLVGSVHHVNGIPIDFDRPTYERCLVSLAGDDIAARQRSLFEQYFDAQHEVIQQLQPEVIGHFDLCRLWDPQISFRDSPTVWHRIERNVKAAVSYGALFEVNAAAFRKGWTTAYPGPDILQLIMSLGGRLTLSDDSHGPHAVGLHYEDAIRYLRSYRVDNLWYLSMLAQSRSLGDQRQSLAVYKEITGSMTVDRSRREREASGNLQGKAMVEHRMQGLIIPVLRRRTPPHSDIRR